MRVLYVGAGTGDECVAAARKGAQVTIVDRSREMLRRCDARLRAAGQSAKLVQADARHLGGAERFDAVVTPFFLNVFGKDEVAGLLLGLCKSATKGGLLLCVDFRGPSDRPFFAALQRAYYLPPLAFFFCAARNAWHEIYDYEAIARASGAPLTLEERLVERAYGLPLLETLVWRVS
jgi:demethylmenaquinone methyltransferase/2-methoxy-6-polyprenyl-1,4-benzoquinol methylase